MRIFNILIIDDAFFIRNLLKKAIGNKPKNKYHFKVLTEATNGKEGLSFYKKFKPDIVTVDINMPMMNGLKFVQEIKKINPNAEIICISSNMDSKVRSQMSEYCSFYLPKPFQDTYLWNMLDSIGERLSNPSVNTPSQPIKKEVVKDILDETQIIKPSNIEEDIDNKTISNSKATEVASKDKEDKSIKKETKELVKEDLNKVDNKPPKDKDNNESIKEKKEYKKEDNKSKNRNLDNKNKNNELSKSKEIVDNQNKKNKNLNKNNRNNNSNKNANTNANKSLPSFLTDEYLTISDIKNKNSKSKKEDKDKQIEESKKTNKKDDSIKSRNYTKSDTNNKNTKSENSTKVETPNEVNKSKEIQSSERDTSKDILENQDTKQSQESEPLVEIKEFEHSNEVEEKNNLLEKLNKEFNTNEEKFDFSISNDTTSTKTQKDIISDSEEFTIDNDKELYIENKSDEIVDEKSDEIVIEDDNEEIVIDDKDEEEIVIEEEYDEDEISIEDDNNNEEINIEDDAIVEDKSEEDEISIEDDDYNEEMDKTSLNNKDMLELENSLDFKLEVNNKEEVTEDKDTKEDNKEVDASEIDLLEGVDFDYQFEVSKNIIEEPKDKEKVDEEVLNTEDKDDLDIYKSEEEVKEEPKTIIDNKQLTEKDILLMKFEEIVIKDNDDFKHSAEKMELNNKNNILYNNNNNSLNQVEIAPLKEEVIKKELEQKELLKKEELNKQNKKEHKSLFSRILNIFKKK